MPYIELALVGDVDSLTETGLDYLEEFMGPNWLARAGNPETVMIEGSGQIAGELIDQAAVVPPEALKYLGTDIYGFPMREGTNSSMPAVFQFAVDAPATSVSVDAQVAVPHPDGNQYIFLTDRDMPAPAGGGSMDCNLIALDIGSAQNGAFGESVLIEITEGVEMVVAGIASGGSDAESTDQYLDRLTSYLTVPRRPVLPEDHVKFALQVPGVGRASAYNLYYPGTTERDAGRAVGDFDLWTPLPAPPGAQTDVARCTTVAITGEEGMEPSTTLMNDVYKHLDANREVNFLNFVIKPVYTQVDVKAAVKGYPGYAPPDVLADAKNMLMLWLSETGWGSVPGQSAGVWASDNKVRLYEAVDYINRAQSVWYCEDVMLRIHGDTTWVEGDITLPGVVSVAITDEDSIELTSIP